MEWQDSTSWSCESCTLLNKARDFSCTACNSPRPRGFVPLPPASKTYEKAELPTYQEQDDANAWGSDNEVDEENNDEFDWDDEEDDDNMEESQSSIPTSSPTETDDWGDDFVDPDAAGFDSKLEEELDLIESPYVCMNEKALILAEHKLIREIVDVLSVSKTHAATLLRYFNWNKDRLLEEWMSDADKVRSSAGVLNERIVKPAEVGTIDCFLCVETVPVAKSFCLECGHQYCTQCWKNYLNAEFEKGPKAIFTSCVEYKCNEIVSDDVFRKLMPRKKYQKIREYYRSSFVTGNMFVEWCPAPGCVLACEYTQGGPAEILCDCGNLWCFRCQGVAHRPATCKLVEDWGTKNTSDAENVTWIKANTKNCPKCKVHIEKNQGCNHMTCKNCRYEFCWLCKGKWSSHKNCNKVDGVIKSEMEADKAANELKRYMFFYERFENHYNSIKFAEKTRINAHVKMSELQMNQGSSDKHVEFVIKAVDEVICCHRVLAWTYAFGFFLKCDATRRALFEGHQERLEIFTDQLHELSEQRLSELADVHIRTLVIDKTRVIGTYRTNVIKCVEDM